MHNHLHNWVIAGLNLTEDHLQKCDFNHIHNFDKLLMVCISNIANLIDIFYMGGENSNIYNIGSIGGNFNQSIQNGYVQVHGNINISQDLPQAAAQIQQLLTQLQSQGYSSTDAQNKVANDWANEAKNNPQAKGSLVKLGHYMRDAAANGVIGEVAVEVIKLALKLSGIPLP